MILWAAALLLASGARAASVCARVEVLGKPLPYGLASLVAEAPAPASATRPLERVEDGRVCFGDVAPGRYAVEVSPLGFYEPMPLALRGLPGDSSQYRVGVAPGGGAAVFDRAGTRRMSSLPVLDYRPEPSEAGWAKVEGALSFPKGARPAPFLLVARVLSIYRFVWISGERPRFELVVPPGSLQGIVTSSREFAIAATEPPYSLRGGDSLEFHPSQTTRMRLRMRPAGRLSGKITLPSGEPLRPSIDGGRRLIFSLCLTNPWATQAFCQAADARGRFDYPSVPEGFWEMTGWWSGPGAERWAIAPSAMRWFAAGRETSFDYPLPYAGEVVVKPEGVKLAPLWQTQYSRYSPVSLRVLGEVAGRFDPKNTFAYFLENEMPFAFVQAYGARWEAVGAAQAMAAHAQPPGGTYNALLIKNARWLDFLSTRILAMRRDVAVKPGARTEIAFSDADYYPEGSGEIRGTVKATRKWKWPELYEAKSLSEFDRMLGFFVNFYDAKGRFLGMCPGNLSNKDYDALAPAIEGRDYGAFDALLYKQPGEFRFKGLAPGRYRAEVVVFGYPLKEIDVEVADDKPGRIAVDLDRP